MYSLQSKTAPQQIAITHTPNKPSNSPNGKITHTNCVIPCLKKETILHELHLDWLLHEVRDTLGAVIYLANFTEPII